MRLLVGSSPKSVLAYVGEPNYRAHFGALYAPRGGSRAQLAVELGVPWALDNDAFNGFDERRFMNLLRRYQGIPGCVFCVSPDVVGNAPQTLLNYAHWRPVIQSMGYPIGYAAQDGQENWPIPWSSLDCLFIGGSTKWKLGSAASSIAREAKRRGKWLHMGRVNSGIRLRYAQWLGCDSVDGTGYAAFLHRCTEALPYLQTRQHSLWEEIEC